MVTVAVDGSLQLVVCFAPDFITLPIPCIDCLDIGGLPRPREQWGLVAKCALEWHQVSGGLMDRVLCILDSG